MRALLVVLDLFQLTGYPSEPRLDGRQIHAIVGEPARIERAAPEDGRLHIVSWNIAQGVRYEEVRDTLARLDADIYLLQEVDLGVRRSDYRNVARDLADDLGLNWVFGGEFQELGQSRRGVAALTGQAVLSRYPIHDAVALPFDAQAELRWRLDPLQPRRGGRMALRAESGGVVLYNAHIESARNDVFRARQVDELLRDGLAPERRDRPVVLAGDLNTEQLPDESPVVRGVLDAGFTDALGAVDGPRPTSVRHDQPLDWMFSRNLDVERGRVVPGSRASDHLPLEATVRTEPATEALVSDALARVSALAALHFPRLGGGQHPPAPR